MTVGQLRSIASRVEASRNPSRSAVASALRGVLAGMKAEDIQSAMKALEQTLGIVRSGLAQHFKVGPSDPPHMRKVDAGGASWVLVSTKPVDDAGAAEWTRLMETVSDGADEDGEEVYDASGNPL